MYKTPLAGRLARPELLELLDRSRDFLLTLLLAPAGFGKSTLLSQWLQQLGDRQYVHICLTRRDRDATRCLQKLNEALRNSLPGFSVMPCNALNAELEQAALFAGSLVEALTRVNHDFYIVIDDFHYAGAALVQNIFSQLIAELPSHIHLLIASRSHPGFSLSRLKLEDRLLLIDSHDLRLPADNFAELCQLLQQPALEPAESAALLQMTEGWMAGIKLALLARGRTGHLLPRDFHGNQPEMVDYFVDVVLNELTPGLRDFLLNTAIFDQFDLSLCQSLLPAADCADILEQIIQHGLFIMPVEDHAGFYRYHPLFQRFLRSRLLQEAPTRAPQLHLAAARHFMAHQEEEAALMHARLAEQPAEFLAMLAPVCDRWLHQGKLLPILSWLETLPEDTLYRHADLYLPYLAALIFSRRFQQAHYHLNALRCRPDWPQTPVNVVGAIAFLLQVLTLFTSDSPVESETTFLTCQHTPYHDIRDAASVFLARHLMLNGQCQTAIRQTSRAKLLLTKLGHDYFASFADVILILSERELGHITIARQMTQDFYNQHAERPLTPAWMNASTCMAVSLYEQNRITEARALCEQLIMLVDSACATEMVFFVYVTLARLHQQTGQSQRSGQLLQQLRRILRHGQYQRLLNQLLVEELSHALRSGQSNTIKHIAHDYRLPEQIQAGLWQQPRDGYQDSWVFGGIAAALYLRSRKQYDKALHILNQLEHTLLTSEMRTRLLVVQANQIVILRLQEQETQVMQQLVTLFNHVGLQCAIRSIFDETPGFGEIVRQGHEQGHIVLPEFYLQLYADVLYPPAPEPVAAPSTDELTAKELEVLALMKKGLANKEICRELNISLSTAKWHVKNILAKLQVNNRTAAILTTLTPVKLRLQG